MKREPSVPRTRSGGICFVSTLGCLAIGLGAIGCADPDGTGEGGRRSAGWTPISLPNVSRQAAFDAGVYAMRQWFPRLAEASPAEGVIRSVSEEYEQAGGTGRLRDGAVKYRNRMRRTATLVIRDREAGAIARCRVEVQRLDTQDHRVFGRNEQFDDVPSETPIDRDAGVRPDQDQVWTDMPRDRELERNILSLLRRRATGESEPGA